MSLYADYAKERLDRDCVERDEGFATYQIHGPECYIVDIYVKPTHRQAGVASQLADVIAEIAKAKGCTHLIGSVQPSTPGSTTSLKVLLAYGFRLLRAEPDFIVLVKELNNG